MRWSRILIWPFVIVLAGGCASNKVVDYCAVAQKPFQWDSISEVDATPIRPLRYIETGAEIYMRVCS